MEWFAIFNLILAILSWKWAVQSFNNGANGAGWFNIFASALNAAAFANIVF